VCPGCRPRVAATFRSSPGFLGQRPHLLHLALEPDPFLNLPAFLGRRFRLNSGAEENHFYMAVFASDSVVRRTRCRFHTAWLATLLFCLSGLVLMPGCGGCGQNPPQTQEEAEKRAAELREKLKKQEKKPDFEVGVPLAVPHERETRVCWYKPGHWTSAVLAAKTNNFDLHGNLGTTPVDRRGDPMNLPGMPFEVTGLRPVDLPKGWPKVLDMAVYVPHADRNVQLGCRISARKGGRAGWEGSVTPALFKQMPAYQYHFAVFARWPESYAYLKKLDSLRDPTDLLYGHADRGHYRVSLIEPRRPVALPSQGLYWTSIAYLLWDDADPNVLSLDQQLALLDWLHFGGQLIVSGPDTLNALRGGFLAPYLPATSPGTREVAAADFKELNDRWVVPEPGSKSGLPLEPLKPWAGAELERHPQARDVPGTGGLLVERRVGRGRVVVSAFGLSERQFKNWPSRDSFFNACLLGRPRRNLEEDDALVQARWPSGSEYARRELDPLLVSKLRYFSRDSGRPATVYRPPDDTTLGYPAEEQSLGPGVASWNDFSDVANAARQALTTAAEIEIPKRDFVVWVMAGYLLVLVPVNWLFFRLIGRVEWAWAAAPVIAIVCTVVVIKLARLDIGFARSLSEIAVVEVQGDYPRAHVARYTAMYTSLSTTYSLHSEDPGMQMLPFPGETAVVADDSLFSRKREKLVYRYGKNVSLEGFRIISNSADMVHTERMVDLGGTIGLVETADGRPQVVNQTEYTLRGAGVMRGGADGLEVAWLGTLEPGESATISFRPAHGGEDERLWQEERSRSMAGSAGELSGELNLGPLIELAERRKRNRDGFSLQSGDCRLVGWLDEELPGLAVKPSAPQARRAALVVAHLEYGFGVDPSRDDNSAAQIRGNMPRTFSVPEIEDTSMPNAGVVPNR